MDVGSLLENEMLEVLLIDDFKKSTSIEMCKSKKKNIEFKALVKTIACMMWEEV